MARHLRGPQQRRPAGSVRRLDQSLHAVVVSARLWESGKVTDDELREAVRLYKYELDLVVQDDLDREEQAELRRARRKRGKPEPETPAEPAQPLLETA